jgi:hypothetical protein
LGTYLLLLLCMPHHDRHLLLEVTNNVCMNFAEAHALHQLVDLSHSTVGVKKKCTTTISIINLTEKNTTENSYNTQRKFYLFLGRSFKSRIRSFSSISNKAATNRDNMDNHSMY